MEDCLDISLKESTSMEHMNAQSAPQRLEISLNKFMFSSLLRNAATGKFSNTVLDCVAVEGLLHMCNKINESVTNFCTPQLN